MKIKDSAVDSSKTNQIRDKIKQLQEKADLIDLMEVICGLDSFLDFKILKKYLSNSDLSLKIHCLIKEFLLKHIDFIKNNVDYSPILTISPSEIVILKTLVDRLSSGNRNLNMLTAKPTNDIGLKNDNKAQTNSAIFATNPNYNTNASNNEQAPLIAKKNIAFVIDPTCCMNIVGSSVNQTAPSHRILMGSKIQIIKDEGDTYRARLVDDNVEFSIYKDLVEFK